MKSREELKAIEDKYVEKYNNAKTRKSRLKWWALISEIEEELENRHRNNK